MHWPELAALDADQRLQEPLQHSRAWRPDVAVHTLLRHVPGRRVTALATSDGDTMVVKVFSSPRARGNHRRLSALERAGLGDLVPTSFGHDPSGHVGALGFRDGAVLDQLPDDRFIAACTRAGLALRRLHDSGAELDRGWTLDDEADALRRRATTTTRPFVDTLLHCVTVTSFGRAAGTPVPSHRDCHPRQLIADGTRVHWIDLDDCTMAPAGLDVGNMAAHLTRERLIGRRSIDVAIAARQCFLDGYGWDRSPFDLARWELLSLARLAGLAESRHGSLPEREALLREATRAMLRMPADRPSVVPV
jgi:hypothetical protein